MRRSEYLAQIILGVVGLATLFKLIAVIGMIIAPEGPDGPMTRTFQRTASVGELTRELKPLVDLFQVDESAGGGTTLVELGDLRPTPEKISAVLAAEACYALPPGREAQPGDLCSDERLARIETLVRWWALFALCATILVGGLFWGIYDTFRRWVFNSKYGKPRSVDRLSKVFEQAVKKAQAVHQPPDTGADRPHDLADLISGDFRFLPPPEVADPAEPGVTFWLVSGLIIAGSALVALSGGILVAALMVVVALGTLVLLRFLLDRLQADGVEYLLQYERVVRPAPAEVAGDDPAATPLSAEAALEARAAREAALRKQMEDLAEERLAIARENLTTYEAFLKGGFRSVAEQNPASGERRVVLAFGLGLLMLLAGHWLAAHLIPLIDVWVFGTGSEWSLSEGLAPLGQLLAALKQSNAANALAGPVLLAVVVALLALSFGLALVADRRRAHPSRDRTPARLFTIAAVGAAWVLFVYLAAVLTWLAGVPEARQPGEAFLVRGGLVCEAPDSPVKAGDRPEAAGVSATWAFGDDGRTAFDLGGDPGACTLNTLIRHPDSKLAEWTRAPARAELAIVVGLASFEGAVETEEQLAARRAQALAREHAGLRVLSIVLGQYTGPAPESGVRPAGSAPQRKVLVYLAGRRGSGARPSITAVDEARLLQELRRDLEVVRGLDVAQYSTCVVQAGDAMTIDADLTKAFGCPDPGSGATASPSPATAGPAGRGRSGTAD
ncbi:MAG: hypothetical protein ACK5VL_10440 [Brevundimonas sp.]